MTAQTSEHFKVPRSKTFHVDISDGVEVDDSREELALLVGCRGPSDNLLQNFSIASLRLIEARGVD